MLSNTSLYGGMLLAGDDYRSGALGIGQNMLWLGALSFDMTGPKVSFINKRMSKATVIALTTANALMLLIV